MPVLFVLLCATNTSFATTCFEPKNLKQALKWADVGFVGEIVGEEKVIVDQDKTFMVYKFKIEKAWKGVGTEEFIIADYYEALSYHKRDKVGQRYLIFANYKTYRENPMELFDIYVDKNGKAQPAINLCSLTTRLEYPPSERKFLKKLGKPKLIFDEL